MGRSKKHKYYKTNKNKKHHKSKKYKYNPNRFSRHIYSQSSVYKEANGKVIENIRAERNDNKLTIKGIINGKEIYVKKDLN
jgi:hypothetical protein